SKRQHVIVYGKLCNLVLGSCHTARQTSRNENDATGMWHSLSLNPEVDGFRCTKLLRNLDGRHCLGQLGVHLFDEPVRNLRKGKFIQVSYPDWAAARPASGINQRSDLLDHPVLA